MTVLKFLSSSKFTLISFFSFSIFVIGCSKKDDVSPQAPSACFTLPSGDLYAGSSISFDASCSKNVKVYQWKFNDGYLTTGKIVTRAFANPGDYSITLTVTDSLGRSFTKNSPFTVKPSPYTIHEGNITDAEVWAEGLHLVRNDVLITNGGSVTIMPGATVYFNKGMSMYVGDPFALTTTRGTLKAIGTSTKPISFLPVTGVSQPGEWGHIYFSFNATPDCALDYCSIKYGGKAAYYYFVETDYLKHGVVDIDQSTVSITNSSIIGGANYGLHIFDNSITNASLSAFSGNTISGNVNYPIKTVVNAVHKIGTGNTIQGNGILLDDWYYLTADGLWRNLNLPYIVSNYLSIGSNGASGTYHLTLEPGVKILMAKGASMKVDLNGTLTAEGTATAPILFSSNETTKAKGDWENFLVWGQSSFKYCQFEYGGNSSLGDDPSLLAISATGSTVNNCTFTHSATDGMAFYSGDLTNSSGNTFADCDRYGFTVEATLAHQINLTHTFSCAKNIQILASHTELTSTAVWPKRAFPYYFSGSLSIDVNVLGSGSLTISPGVEIRFSPAAGIGVNGTFIADGTTDPIIFTVDDTNKASTANYWSGIGFGSGTSANSKLTGCKLSYGGNTPGYPDLGIVDCFLTANTPTISNNVISNSAGYGLSNHMSTPIVSGNTFTLNAKGDTHTY